jgi:membrane protein implicated in regulation of membrane protease activity
MSAGTVALSDLLSPTHLVGLLWLGGGLILCVAETLAPGTFLVFIGAAAAIVGAIVYFVPLGLTTQLLLFGALVIALVMVGRDLYGSLHASPGPLPQSRAHALIGSDFLLEEGIVHGYGRIRVGDSSWRVGGDDCPAGAKVRVVAVENGSLLRVERV